MKEHQNKILTIFISTFFSIFICYFLYSIKIYLDKHHEYPLIFKSKQTYDFNKYYYDKLHHLRNIGGREIKIKNNPENYMFTEVKKFSENQNNILIQGDSWIEQMDEAIYSKSSDKIRDFAERKKFGLINAGVASYSPILMQLQYQILEKDFNIKPNIVVAYIDQSDLGDELCRYKNKRIYDKNNTLIAVKKESYSKAHGDLTKVFFISKTMLSDNSQLTRTLKFTNFMIKYKFFRIVEKFKSISKNGWKNREFSRCLYSRHIDYLEASKIEDISYFEDRINDYVSFLESKKYIEKIILVTHPHKQHLFPYIDKSNEKRYYSVNVSDIVEKIAKDKNKLYHLNFTKLISNGKVNLDKNVFQENDPSSHVKEEYHANIFTQEIIETLEKI